MVALNEVAGRSLGIDGYNLLITIESALSDGLILIGRDGCYRDLASVHGTYRKVGETVPAVEMIVDYLAVLNVTHIDWYLDQPVSNSGRLKVLIAEVVESRTDRTTHRTSWNIELVHSPDGVLTDYPNPVVSSDSVVLDECGTWVNLAAVLVDTHLPNAWKVDLRSNLTA